LLTNEAIDERSGGTGGVYHIGGRASGPPARLLT
jgi:hypothetical protein